jgi:leucyl/phenylalanyl-tRNA--protein transferase
MPFRPVLLRPGAPLAFPDPRRADEDGLVAVGGDLAPERLLFAYAHGIFPWYDAGPPLWWSPDPRALMSAETFRTSRSLRRFLAHCSWRVTMDAAFDRVMQECGRERTGGTWIHPEMVTAYVRLAERGRAHSVEVWDGTELVGGLYGVQVGALFAAESMFHRRTNASKVALACALRSLFDAGVTVFDVQFKTDHLESLGAFEVTRSEYLERIARATAEQVSLAHLVGTDLLPRVARPATAAS